MKRPSRITISGAGPAGLAAAIAASMEGCQATVLEKRREVGKRFHDDFQGLENWSRSMDVLEELASWGIEPNFEHVPVREVVCFDPAGREKTFRSAKPLFYLLRRGEASGTLDHALKAQALEQDVEIHLSTRASSLPGGGIVTEGPRRSDAIATGYLFDTDMADGIYAVISDELAPKGYGYVLINGGRGTLAACLFTRLEEGRKHAERCLRFFEQAIGLKMRNPRRFGGIGNFSLPSTCRRGNILFAGEAAGFQDPLFGFGIRCAILSGASAGRALSRGTPEAFERFWKKRLRDYHRTASTNRWFFERLGNAGYRRVMAHFPADGDVREWLHHAYRPRLWKKAWHHLISGREKPLTASCRADCECTWCRCP